MPRQHPPQVRNQAATTPHSSAAPVHTATTLTHRHPPSASPFCLLLPSLSVPLSRLNPSCLLPSHPHYQLATADIPQDLTCKIAISSTLRDSDTRKSNAPNDLKSNTATSPPQDLTAPKNNPAPTHVIPSDPKVTTPCTAPPPIPTIPTPTHHCKPSNAAFEIDTALPPNLSSTVEPVLPFNTTVCMYKLQKCGSNLAVIFANII
ncbi:hypothetical protein BC826DRAFT_1111666 [Russula brevipes]|nr:hypothetical protein BC826DRAFT_1111666 [Russula brevipes]